MTHTFCPNCRSLAHPPNSDPETGLCPACQSAKPKPKPKRKAKSNVTPVTFDHPLEPKKGASDGPRSPA